MNFRLLSLLGAVAVSTATAQNTFTLRGPGTAAAMNSTGTAVVGTDNQGAFLWTATGGYLPLGQRDAVAVSEDGTIVFGNMVDAMGMDVAGRWTQATGWVSIGGLQGSSGTSLSSAYDMSGDGTRATGLGWINASRGAAFDWDMAAGMLPLPQLGTNSSRGNAVSLDGSTIGGWDEHSTGPRRACIWGPGLVETLLLENPATNIEGIGEVYALSSDGTWACGTELSDAFVWSQAGGVVNFGPLPNWFGGFFDNGASLAVSDDGSRVVGSYGSFFNSAATIWSPTGGYMRLSEAMVAAGMTLPAYDLTSAVDMSPDGRIILGNAVPSGSFATEWFIATLDGPIGSSFCPQSNPNSSGFTSSLGASGSQVVSGNSFTLTAFNLPQNVFGLFTTSMTIAGTPSMPSNSQGTLCLGGAIGRFNNQIQFSGTTGIMSIAVDLQNVPQPNTIVAVMAGETWHFQAWHRDDNPTITSNFTNGVSVLFQ